MNGVLTATLAAGLLAAALSLSAAGATAVGTYRPVAPGEHPRLIVRGDEGVADVRGRAATEWGRKVVVRTRQAVKLSEKLSITGRNQEVIKEAGFKAAGYGALHLLDGDAAAAQAARETVLREVVGYPMKASLTVAARASRLHGTALAYDLCYAAWDEPTRRKVRAFLVAEAEALVEAAGEPGAAGAPQPEHVMAHAAVGLAEMAVLGDGDAAESPRRLDACEGAIVAYLEQNIGPHGFDARGESVREAALASGILPFLRAQRLVLGRDLTGRPAVASSLRPMIYQCVPGVGIAVTGEATLALDRSGLFAMAADLVPAAERPAVAWLFRQVGGEAYLGVVRPHQGLYMLLSGLEGIEPAPPGDDWPRALRSDPAGAGYALFRTGWKDADDILTVVYDGSLRILGLGAQWAAHPGFDARGHGHSPGAASFDNVFSLNPGRDRRLPSRFLVPVEEEGGVRMRPPGGGPNAWMLRRGGAVYRVRQTWRLVGLGSDADARVGSAAFTFRGEAQRLLPTFQERVTEDLASRPSDWAPRSVPEGGPFEGERVVGVDYTGLCGAPALLAVADRLTGVAGAERVWVLHVGANLRIETDEAGFTLSCGDASLRGTVVHPADVMVGASSAGRAFNYLTVETTAERIEVVMTLGRGKPPDVAATAGGLAAGVTVGKRRVRLVDGRIVLAGEGLP